MKCVDILVDIPCSNFEVEMEIRQFLRVTLQLDIYNVEHIFIFVKSGINCSKPVVDFHEFAFGIGKPVIYFVEFAFDIGKPAVDFVESVFDID